MANYYPQPGQGQLKSKSKYRTYAATISQNGVNVPTVRVLENDFQNTGTWTRSGVGTYILTANGNFPDPNQMIMTVGNNIGVNNDYVINIVDANRIQLRTYNNGTLSDGLLQYTPILIMIYQ